MAASYNYVYIEDSTFPGKPDANPYILEVCDEEGMLVGLGPLPVTGFFSDIDEPRAWNDWTSVTRHVAYEHERQLLCTRPKSASARRQDGFQSRFAFRQEGIRHAQVERFRPHA